MKGSPSILAFAAAFSSTVWALWLLGEIVRDRTWVTALFFYVPSLVVALALVAFGLLLLRYSRRMAICAAVLAIPPLTVALAVENHWTPPPSKTNHGPAFTIVHWNVYHGRRGWDRVKGELAKEKADIYIIQELEKEQMTQEEAALCFGPGYSYLRVGSMAIVGRGKLTIGKNLMHDQAWAHLATWEPIGAAVGARPLTLLLGHLPSSLLIARHPRLQEIRSLIEMHHPDLIVGDFNTPRRSWVFAHLPKGYAHAYDVAGSGWSYTWPVPCPLWAIDQCIVGPRVEAIRYELHSKWASDHRLQRLQFRLRDSGNGAEERSP